MKEDLLHFIWRCDKLQGRPLTTTTSQNIVIKRPGTLNQGSGPDFFNALIEVGGQLWAGNIEMHLKSSDWYAHHHESDDNYDNVVLHVVWEDDITIFRKDGSQIETLELKNHVDPALLTKYQELFNHFNPSFINCERDFPQFDSLRVHSFLDRLYLERLEQKSKLIFSLLKASNNDWEGTLFVLLAKSFGTKVNGDFFFYRAKSLSFSIIRKECHDLLTLESLFFGHFGLLVEKDCTDGYFLKLKKEYQYLTRKYELPSNYDRPEFFGLRPSNFPTLRLSQLAQLFYQQKHLFSLLMEQKQLKNIYELFNVGASDYWDDHFTFGKLSRKSKKRLTKKFIDLLVINAVIPLKFCYSQYIGQDWSNHLISMVSEVKSESNSIIANFEALGSGTANALESQAKIQLYTQYCSKNKCLNCALGMHLLNRNT
ncbi:DUF2851 family protein [Flagellimonas nanhaiensis]|uniref:DUF2851 family protein n=1 Tax=Flagellimonas nanhaiensis TaxID=2292706 RepID=A0A371JM52_9FLAO|nr:DUF2851 family protein [Allomuricauda nanhaiensis]RDY58160.1 DUF2851 family protein [Allomuricauda nanhaiensis]